MFSNLFLEQKSYRESYISDDLDLDPPGSESSPGLSRLSTSSSGIEVDARQHSLSTEMASMEEDGQRPADKCLSSAASHVSSSTSGVDAGSKTQIEEEEWQEEGERISEAQLYFLDPCVQIVSAAVFSSVPSSAAGFFAPLRH